MTDQQVDVVVIGGGPGGYVAALRVAQLNGRVVLIERDTVGGTCLNRGCIPTKSLYTSAKVLNACRNASQFGVNAGAASPNPAGMISRKDKIVGQLVRGVESLLKRADIRIVEGTGRILGPGQVEAIHADGTREIIETRTILVATGSEPARLPILPTDSPNIIDSTEALKLTEITGRLVVIGAGAVGLELATIYHTLGSKVIVIEMLPQILPAEDDEVAGLLEKELVKQGLEILTGMKVIRAAQKSDCLELELSSGRVIQTDVTLVAAGRSLNTENIGLETIGVQLNKRQILVNSRMQTNIPGVYAIGDVVGGWMLAHVASKQGLVAAENIMGIPTRMDYRVVPRTVWTIPEVASVGMTQKEAEEAGRSVRVGRFPFRALGKAKAIGEVEGFVKLIGDAKTDELLGAQMIGPDVTDLIAEVALGMQLETTVEEVAHTIHAHPTLPEAIMEAAHNLIGQPIHY